MLQPLLRFFKAAFKISHIPEMTMAKIEGLIKQVGSSAPECGRFVPASKKRRAPDEDSKQETNRFRLNHFLGKAL